jgi:hypothetical protein
VPIKTTGILEYATLVAIEAYLIAAFLSLFVIFFLRIAIRLIWRKHDRLELIDLAATESESGAPVSETATP